MALAGAGAASAENKDKAAKKTASTSGAVCPMDDDAKLKTVLTFLHTANENEIKHAKLAVDRAQSPEVKAFADRMVREHTDADKKLTDVAAKKGIDLTHALPADPIHAAVRGTDAKMEQSLQGKKGAAFDAAYIAPEVMEHNLVLAVIEEGQKVAKDDEVKRTLNEMHQTVSLHREHASTLMERMKLGGTGAAIGGGPGSDTEKKSDKSKKGTKDWITPDKGTGPDMK